MPLAYGRPDEGALPRDILPGFLPGTPSRAGHDHGPVQQSAAEAERQDQPVGPERAGGRHNYRSSQRVLELAQQIQPNGGIGLSYFQGVSEIHSFADESAEADWVIRKIKSWLAEGQYREANKEVAEAIGIQNIAVLARHKYVF
jgi:hypothetical protein